jgi:hypothetical protein
MSPPNAAVRKFRTVILVSALVKVAAIAGLILWLTAIGVV